MSNGKTAVDDLYELFEQSSEDDHNLTAPFVSMVMMILYRPGLLSESMFPRFHPAGVVYFWIRQCFFIFYSYKALFLDITDINNRGGHAPSSVAVECRLTISQRGLLCTFMILCSPRDVERSHSPSKAHFCRRVLLGANRDPYGEASFAYGVWAEQRAGR